MTLHNLLQSDACLHLGWILLHSLWQFALIGLIAAVLLACLRSRSHARHAIAYAALLLMALAPLVTYVLIPPPTSLFYADAEIPSTGEAIASHPVSPPSVVVPMPIPPDEATSVADSAPMPGAQAIEVAAVESYLTSPSLSETRAVDKQLARYLAWLAPFWLAGVLALALRQLGGWLLARRVLRAATPIADRGLRNRLETLIRTMGVRRTVRVMQSAIAGVPMVLGTFRPVLIVPASLVTGLSPDQWDAILAHELAHIRRYDYVLNLLQIVVETLLFYHPAVWWLSRRIRVERELCCDDLATQSCGSPVALAEGLAAIEAARLQGENARLAVTAVGDGRRGLTLRRVRRILGFDETPDRRRVAWLAGLLVLVVIAIGGVAGHLAGAVENEALAAGEAGEDSEEVAEEAEADREPESWEISRIYDAAWMRDHLMHYEVLPKPITVPAIRGIVVDSSEKPVPDADIRSHTPRQWTKLFNGGKLRPSKNEPYTKTNAKGRFGLPERTEPYRVLVAHEKGVASISHEELINADGRIVLQPWARIEGTFVLDGKPQPGEKIILYMNTIPWSYSPGGPRLTLDYETKTDEQGRFAIEGVPPLSGRAHHVSRLGRVSHGIRMVCQPGKTTRADIGWGRTITGRLRVDASNVDWTGASVTVRHERPPLPCPPGLIESGNEDAINEWRREWAKTVLGQAHIDELNQLINLSYPGEVTADGTFQVHGVPEGRYELWSHTRQPAASAKTPIVVDATTGPRVNLNEIDLSEAETKTPTGRTTAESSGTKQQSQSSHDHSHESEAAEESEKELPTLKVHVLDKDGKPVARACVLLYDRNHYMAGMTVDFEQVTKYTDKDGWADFGTLPQDFVCVQVQPREGAFDGSYAVISETEGKFVHTNPGRPLIDIQTSEETVTLVFTMRRGVDVTFDMVDAETGEQVFWSHAFYWDERRERWWTIALIDGGGQHNFTTIVEEMSDRQLRAAAEGYYPVDFRLDAKLELGKKFKQKIELKPAPEVRFTVLTPEGKPAKDAKFKKICPEGLGNMLSSKNQTDEDGALVISYPAEGDLARFEITHESGRAEFAIKDLPDPIIIEEDGKRKEVTPWLQVRLVRGTGNR